MEKRKKKVNYLKILWVSGIYIALIIILVLVVIFKVKYEGRWLYVCRWSKNRTYCW